MDVKHAAARKSFELAFSGVYKYINKNKEAVSYTHLTLPTTVIV